MKIEIVENNVVLVNHSNENFEIHPLWLRERAKTENLICFKISLISLI